MVEFKMRPDKTALLLIDMTNGFLMPGSPLEVPGGRELIPKLTRLIDVCRDRGVPIIFVTLAYRKDGSDMGLRSVFHPDGVAKGMLLEGSQSVEFYRGIQPEKTDIVLTKRRYSAFVGTELNLILWSKGIDTLIIGGVAANMCCECTARDARQMDYKVIFLSDGNASMNLPDVGWGTISSDEIQRLVLATMAYGFAQVLSVEEVISRLVGQDG